MNNSYLERYLSEEYQQVWDELISLGELERDSPLYQDAYQVTTELMVRVEQNLNTIVACLKSVDYRFAFPEEVHLPPGKHIGEKIQELETLVGPLPLSLRAWYQIVGSVNLMGSHPELAFYSEKVFFEPPEVYPDPLVVFPFEYALEEARNVTGEENWGDMNQQGVAIPVAPDEYHKANVSGGAPYEISVPNAGVDAPLENEWHETTFVKYLRICCRWGGLPGWERYPNRPDSLIGMLSEGLIPF